MQACKCQRVSSRALHKAQAYTKQARFHCCHFLHGRRLSSPIEPRQQLHLARGASKRLRKRSCRKTCRLDRSGDACVRAAVAAATTMVCEISKLVGQLLWRVQPPLLPLFLLSANNSSPLANGATTGHKHRRRRRRPMRLEKVGAWLAPTIFFWPLCARYWRPARQLVGGNGERTVAQELTIGTQQVGRGWLVAVEWHARSFSTCGWRAEPSQKLPCQNEGAKAWQARPASRVHWCWRWLAAIAYRALTLFTLPSAR